MQTILDVSRLDAGQLVLAPGLVAFSPLLRHAVDVVFVDSNRHIDWKIPKSLPPLWADETYLEKAIMGTSHFSQSFAEIYVRK